MSTYLINDSTLSSMADAIRQQDGISGPITPIAMASRIADFNTEEAIVIQPYQYQSSTITSFSSDVDYILEGAFESCVLLSSVSFPNCKFIELYAFYYCSALTTVSFPSCKTIGNSAFQSCSELTTANFPACTIIGNSAFYRCTSLTTVSFPACISIGSSAFELCNPSLTIASFPSCTNIGAYAFEACTKLTTVSFPACTSIGSGAFYGCYSLTTVSFPACTTIGSYAFNYCFNLTSLYLTGSSVVSLVTPNTFDSTPIGGYSASAGTFGSVYVPSSLLTEYKAAYGWSMISARIVGI